MGCGAMTSKGRTSRPPAPLSTKNIVKFPLGSRSAGSPEVRARTVKKSAMPALEMKVLWPRSDQASPAPLASARVAISPRLDPAPGSVRANAAIDSPLTTEPSTSPRSESLPARAIG